MGHIFNKTTQAPAAKVQDLYADEINADPPSDDDLQDSGAGDEPTASGLASDDGLHDADADVDAGANDDAGADADLGVDDGSQGQGDMDVEFSCGHCPLAFTEQGLLRAHLKQAHSADVKTLLGDKWVQAFNEDLDNVHEDLKAMRSDHGNLRGHISWQEMKFELGLLKQGRRHDQALCEVLADRAMEMREDAEELQRQAAQKLTREKRLNERAAALKRRSRVSEREVQMQKEFDEFYL